MGNDRKARETRMMKTREIRKREEVGTLGNETLRIKKKRKKLINKKRIT